MAMEINPFTLNNHGKPPYCFLTISPITAWVKPAALASSVSMCMAALKLG